MIKIGLFNKTKNSRLPYIIYVYYMCATFHCILTGGVKVMRTLVSAIKSKVATISMETKRSGQKILHNFSYQNEWVEK